MKKLLLILSFAISLQGYCQFPAPYCAEAFPSGREPITLVNFAGINNVTPNAITGAPAHQDFTALIGNVVAGGTYSITLKGNTDGNYNDNFVVFVDWNNDNDFLDANEKYNIGSIVDSDGLDVKQLVGSVAVPSSATAGNKRMRVSKKYNASNTVFQTPCSTTGFGQAEDYTLAVTVPTCISPSNGTAVLDGFLNATLSWTAGTGNNYEIVNQVVGAGVPSSAANTGLNVTGTSYNVPTSSTPETFYEFYVRSECTDGIDYSFWSGPFKYNTVTPTIPNCSTYISPLNGATGVPRFTGGTITNGVELTYTTATGDGVTPLLGYTIFWGTTLANLAPLNATAPFVGTSVFITNSLANTTYFWQIVPVNSIGSAVGCPIFSLTTAVDPLATDTFSSTNFKSFPNPVQNVLNLSYDKNITSISVMNLLGQVVLTNNFENKEAKIDMTTLTTGTYMVKVTSENEVKTIKVIKE